MKNLNVTLACLLLSLPVLAQNEGPDTKVDSLQMACSVWSSYFGAKTYSSSAIATDTAFKESHGVLMVPGTIETHYAYGPLYIPVWKTQQTIQLGLGYSLRLELQGAKYQPAGDFLIDQPSFTMGGVLFNGSKAVSMASTQSERVGDGYSYAIQKTEKLIDLKLKLLNMPLSEALGTPSLFSLLQSDVEKYKQKDEILKQFGSKDGLLTDVQIDCQMPVGWTFTGTGGLGSDK